MSVNFLVLKVFILQEGFLYDHIFLILKVLELSTATEYGKTKTRLFSTLDPETEGQIKLMKNGIS